MPNLKDVAEYAGVSASTVSRVLSDKSYVSEEARKKVLTAVRALDYRPNEMAKSLKLGRSNTIALMVPSVENQIFSVIARGVEETCRKNGYTVVLCNTDEDVILERDYVAKLKNRLIDGFIISSMRMESTYIRKLREEGFPLVLTTRIYDDTIDAVGVDNEQAAYDAVTHLIRTGHRKIGLAMGKQDLPIYLDRYKGYRRALVDLNVPFIKELVMNETDGNKSFYSLTLHMLQSNVQPDAIFATSDHKAFYIMRALHDKGIQIPEEISVMGFDNIELSAVVEPPLSTVSQPLHETGVLAANKLIRQINFKKEKGVLPPPFVDILGTELIIRKSTR